MGGVTEHLGEGRRAEGIIVADEVDDRLTNAVQAVPGLSLLVYEINFAQYHPVLRPGKASRSTFTRAAARQ